MRVLPTPFYLVLALCGSLAAASRAHSDVIQDALAHRGDASLEVGAGVLDSTLVGKGTKEGESEATPCVCFLKEVGMEHSKYAVLEDAREYQAPEECYRECPRECHAELEYKLDPPQAQALGYEGVSTPLTGSLCALYEFWHCACLNAGTAIEMVDEYTWREQRHFHVAETRQVYDSSYRCHSECSCEDNKNYQGLCVDRWEWEQHLYGVSHQHCYHSFTEPLVGLVSCTYTQHFNLTKDTTGGGLAYNVELDELDRDRSGRKPQKNLKLSVARLGEQTPALQPTISATMGLKGQKIKWTVSKASDTRQKWAVLTEKGKVAFSIRKQRQASTWTVHEGKSRDGLPEYYAYKEDDAGSNAEGFKFGFYQDEEKKHYVGMLQRTGRDGEKNRDNNEVEVVNGERSGLIIIMSVLILEDEALEQ